MSLPGVLFPGAPIGISAKEHTVAELMKAQGYATMCIGKWHLGDQPEFLPTRHGFDHYFGLPYSNDMADQKSKVNGVPAAAARARREGDRAAPARRRTSSPLRYTDEAVKFITENKDRAVLPLPAAHGGPHADSSGQIQGPIVERPLRRLGRGGGLERGPRARHAARIELDAKTRW